MATIVADGANTICVLQTVNAGIFVAGGYLYLVAWMLEISATVVFFASQWLSKQFD